MKKHMEYGYVRVSSRDQNEDRQMLAMRALGIPDRCIFIDKQSGKDFERPGYQKLLKKLKADDLLVIKSLDRLGRNYGEMQAQWRLLTKTKKVRLKVLDMPLLDTGDRKDLTQELISDIVLQLLSYVAQTERDMIRQRQAEGIAAAKERGVQFGRPRKARPDNCDEIFELYREKCITAKEAAEKLGICCPTFRRWYKARKP